MFKPIQVEKKQTLTRSTRKKEEVLFVELFKAGDKVKVNPKYYRTYRGESILKKLLTVSNHFINEAANIPIIYFEDYPNEPFPGHHFVKI